MNVNERFITRLFQKDGLLPPEPVVNLPQAELPVARERVLPRPQDVIGDKLLVGTAYHELAVQRLATEDKAERVKIGTQMAKIMAESPYYYGKVGGGVDNNVRPPVPVEPEKMGIAGFFDRQVKKFKQDKNEFEAYYQGEDTVDKKSLLRRADAATMAVLGGLVGAGTILAGEVVGAKLGSAFEPGLVKTMLEVAGAGGTIYLLNFEVFVKRLFPKLAEMFTTHDLKGKQLRLGEFLRRKEDDTKGRFQALALGDLEGKLVASGYGLISSIARGMAGGSHELSVSKPVDGLQAPTVTPETGIHAHGFHHGPEPHVEAPATPVAPEVATTAVPKGWVEHTMTANDTWDSVLGEKTVYSQEMIKVFEANKSQIMEFFARKAANNPQHLVPVQMGTDSHWEYMSVDQMKEKLEWLIAKGYKPGDAEAQAWIERLDKWVSPGVKVVIPPKQ